MENLDIYTPLNTSGCIRAFPDLGFDCDGAKLASPDDPKPGQTEQPPLYNESMFVKSFLSSGSFSSDALDGLPYLPSRLHSLGEEESPSTSEAADDGPELNVDSVHKFIGSPRYHMAGGVPRPKILAHISGTGLAPWEIHRPQKFVRDLVLRRCFSGRVLDAGCGIGDNALYVAKACPGAEVTAVDVVARCLEFATAKAELRNMRGQVDLQVANLLETDPKRLPRVVGPTNDSSYDIVLDSLTFHCFSDSDRERYVLNLRRLLRPGGLIYMNCMSEEETRPGGPRRITVADLLSVFRNPNDWEVLGIDESTIDFHPTFWGGKAKARLYTIRKLQ